MDANRTIIESDFEGYSDAPSFDQLCDAEATLSEIWPEETGISEEAAVEALAMAMNEDANWEDVFWKKINAPAQGYDQELADKIRDLCRAEYAAACGDFRQPLTSAAQLNLGQFFADVCAAEEAARAEEGRE